MGEKSSSARRAVKTATAKRRKEAEAKRATAKVELEEIGKQIAARVKIMRSYDAAAKEKAGHDLRKAQDERDAINNVLLAQARAKCEEAGESFEKFRNQYCPDLSRSRLYVLLAIADGRKTVERDRAEKRESVAKSRAKLSSTSAVGDAPLPGVATSEGTRTTCLGLARRLESKSHRSPATTSTPKRPQRRARRRRQSGSRASRLTTRPHRTTSSSATSRRASTGRYLRRTSCRTTLCPAQEACDEFLPAMTVIEDRRRARVYFTTACDKLDKQARMQAA